MPKADLFTGDNYRGYELAQKDQKYSRRYLDRAIDLVETMTERHSKVLTSITKRLDNLTLKKQKSRRFLGDPAIHACRPNSNTADSDKAAVLQQL